MIKLIDAYSGNPIFLLDEKQCIYVKDITTVADDGKKCELGLLSGHILTVAGTQTDVLKTIGVS